MQNIIYLKAIYILAFLISGIANAETIGKNGFVDYAWLDAVINKTEVKKEACPEINTDIHGEGFKVALEKSFYGSLGVSGSRWFPKGEIWNSVGIGPVKNSFAIVFSEIKNLQEISFEKEKSLPNNFEEINTWKVTDSAYWESQGGVSFYLGAGHSPGGIGVLAVATGGWASYLQKTGPNRVYVEMSRKKIRSISFGVGIGHPTVSIDKAFEKSNGFSYEFVLDNQESIEAFERFMAGDMTKAHDLSKIEDSGVNKIADLSESLSSFSKNFGIATPFIPFLSFKKSSEKSYSHSEENSVWDENIMKDAGVYIVQKNSKIFGKQLKEARSFIGGKITSDFPGPNGSIHTEKFYANFKYAYQSNWGRSKRLKKYIEKAKSFTGLVGETCARVPSFDDTLGFNQVLLEINWSDEYIRTILASVQSDGKFFKNIQKQALYFQKNSQDMDVCRLQADNDNYDKNCSANSATKVQEIFSNLENYARSMKKSITSDKKEFFKSFTKFGQEVWKSPFVFKAFYETGKKCGQLLKFEISGQRLTRHLLEKKHLYNPECKI